MINKNIPESFMITERGVRKPANHCPHSMAFPAMMSALRTFMGLPSRLRDIQAHGTTWKADDDYYFQIGVSAEGFGLCYGMSDMLKTKKWDNQQLGDCFASEGIEYCLVADESIPIKDASINPETIRDDIVSHLLTDRPVILIRGRGWTGGSCKLVIGYTDFGNVLIIHNGGKGVRISKTAKPLSNWQHRTFAVLFVNGLTEPVDRKVIVLRALSRAYSMLNEKIEGFAEYGYGKFMWNKWIARLDDDNNYCFKSHALHYITPEKFDLAERRCYGADFFDQAQEILNEDLSIAAQSFRDIHDKMWVVHWMATGENEGKTLERETRNKIIDILIECQALDLKAAENIKWVLDKYNQLEPAKFDNHVNVIDDARQLQNPTYLRRAKGLVKNGRAEWVDEKTIRVFDSSGQNTTPHKIIENIIPSSFSLEHPVPMIFPAMCACVDLKIKGSKTNDETKRKNLTNMMSLCMATSGIGFLHVLDREWLFNPNKPYRAEYSSVLTGDDFICHTMKFLGYDYKVIKNNGSNKDEMFSCIQKYINNDIPILAEKVVGQYWSIIAGYGLDQTIYGHYPKLAWLPEGQTIGGNPADGFGDNGMFIKKDWYDYIERIVVIKGKNKEAASMEDFLTYWCSIMEMQGDSNFLCGFKAHDAMITLLQDDDFWQNTDYVHLKRAYEAVRAMGCGLPECRVYTAGAIAHHFVKHFKKETPENFWPFERAVDQYFHDTHKQCWNVWRTSGDGIENKQEYIEPFRASDVRCKVLKLFETIRQNDVHVYQTLKK